MSSDSESITTFYMKRTLRRTPAGEQVSYGYKAPKASSSVSDSYTPIRGRRYESDAAARAAKRPDVSTYRRRKYPSSTMYHVWFVFPSLPLFFALYISNGSVFSESDPISPLWCAFCVLGMPILLRAVVKE